MHTLPEVFLVATCWGIWEPIHWKSDVAKILYRINTIFNVIAIILFMLSEMTALIFLTKSVSDFAEASYVFLCLLCGCIKGINFLLRKKRVKRLLNMLQKKECIPRNVEEMQLRSYYDKISRFQYTRIC